jgi:predicted phage tail protein
LLVTGLANANDPFSKPFLEQFQLAGKTTGIQIAPVTVHTVRELVLLALLSAFLCVVALIYAEPIATAVFAALTSGCVVIAAGLSRGSWT